MTLEFIGNTSFLYWDWKISNKDIKDQQNANTPPSEFAALPAKSLIGNATVIVLISILKQIFNIKLPLIPTTYLVRATAFPKTLVLLLYYPRDFKYQA